MDWKSLAGLGTEVVVNVAVSRYAPGVGGAVVGGLAGGAAKSVAESTLRGKGVDVEDVTKSAFFGAGGSLAGHGVASGLGAASRLGAKGVASKLAGAKSLSDDATKAANEWKTADNAVGQADSTLKFLHKGRDATKYQKAQDAVTQAKKDADAAMGKWESAQIKADSPGFSVAKMKDREKVLDFMGKHLRGGKSKASNKTEFKQGGWGNTGLRVLGGSIAAGRTGGGDSAQSSPGNGKGGGKDKPGPQMQQIEVAWGGAKYMKGEQKEPFAPDPNYKTSGSTTGFLLYPVGVNQQIRDWYVG